MGGGLSTRQIAVLCKEHLGTSKVHQLRHTFAREMEAAGAKVSDIQARLGHESLATTGRYLAALKSAENAHGDALAARFGFGEEE
jgi:integrase